MKKKIVSALLTATMVCGMSVVPAVGVAAADDTITVGFSQVGAESDWRTANTESMKSTFSEENGYELIFDDAQQKQENQLTAIRNFIQQEVDYILEGRKAAEWLNAYTTAKGIDAKDVNIVDIQGTIGSTAQIGRSKGLEEGVDNYGWNLLAQQSGEFTQAKGQEVMESMLKQYDNINVVYCENDNEAFGAIDAIEAAGKTVGSDIANGEIMVMSFDTTNAGLTDTLAGKIACDVECNPLHGPRAEELIKALEAGEEVEKLNYVDEEIFATDDTVDKVKAVNSLDEEGEYDVTPITQEIIDGRAY